MTDKEQKALEKEAHGLLAEAKKLLREAGKLAEKGRFSLSFYEAHYFPESAIKDLDSEAESSYDLTPEQREQLEESTGYLREGQTFGDWWVSSNCW